MSSNPHHLRHGMMTDNSAVHQVLPTIFRKIVRLLIGTVSYPVLVDLLKSIYVEEAKRIFEGTDCTVETTDDSVTFGPVQSNMDIVTNKEHVFPIFVRDNDGIDLDLAASLPQGAYLTITDDQNDYVAGYISWNPIRRSEYQAIF